MADLWTWNVLGRVGVALTSAQKIDLSASYYQNVQQTDFTTDPSVNTAPPGTLKARAVPGLDLEDHQGTRNVLASASYRHVRVLGGDLTAQLYFRSYVTVFFPFDGRELASYGAVVQARLESQRLGGRLQMNTPLTDRYTTLARNHIEGGRPGFAETLLNAGVVVILPARFSTFASFTQGYSLPDVGLILRNAPEGSTLESLNTAPQQVNAVELGVRREGGSVSGSVAAFYSASALGVSSGGFSAPVVRAPERVYGVEATLEARFLDSWRVGSGVGFLEGELDKKDDGIYTYLNGYRVPPPKVSAYVGTQVRPGWNVQLLGVYSGSRDRFAAAEEPGFEERPVASFLLCELLSTGEVGPGRQRVGIANLLNRQVTPVTSQLLWSDTNTSHAAGSGMRASVGYSVMY